MDLPWRLAYRLAHSARLLWWAIRRPAARGAGIAVWSAGRLLVVETSYRPGLLDLPGGAVERGESVLAAALRELAEETGLRAPEPELEGPLELGFPFERRQIRCAVFAWRPMVRPMVRVDGREVVRATWLSPEEARNRRLAPGLALYLARVTGSVAGAPVSSDGTDARGTGQPGRREATDAQRTAAGGAESGGSTPPQTSPT